MTSGASGLDPVDGCNRPIQSVHGDGTNALLADGSVRFVSANINFSTLTNLANRNDRHELGDY